MHITFYEFSSTQQRDSKYKINDLIMSSRLLQKAAPFVAWNTEIMQLIIMYELIHK
jgi:hypothetical protein